MNLYDIAIARKLSGGGGGGGSSDFTKAEVTIIPHPIYGSNIQLAPFDPMNPDYTYAVFLGINGLSTEVLPLELGEPTLVTSYVLTGYFFIAFNSDKPTQTYLVEGNAEASTIEGMNFVKIYGDCTITIS